MATVVREAISFLERDLSRRKVEVARDLPDEPVWVALDEMQLRQALFNLLRNADEAMPEGGRIHVRLQVLEGGESNPLGEAIDGELARVRRAMLTVRDEGAGIDNEMAAKIFNPFVTTKMTGTGLGLAVTRQNRRGTSRQNRVRFASRGGRLFRAGVSLCRGRTGPGILDFWGLRIKTAFRNRHVDAAHHGTSPSRHVAITARRHHGTWVPRQLRTSGPWVARLFVVATLAPHEPT
ncbi:MAG: ATP-binding protein [Polyangiaceae bacterium]